VQAEAVGDLIDALAPAQARAALRQLEGGLSRRLAELREALVDAQALLSYEIDFPGEDDGPVPPARIGGQLALVADRIEGLLRTAPSADRMRQGALLVLAGRPNAGKSSLFNALLGSERALVTEVPGTTRDTIEAHTDFLGWPVRLADTAGLGNSTDRIDRMGIEVSRRYLAAADLVLLCVESGRAVEPDEAAVAAERPCLVIRTKRDLSPGGNGQGLGVSVVTGEGIGDLRRSAAERVFGDRMALGDLEPALSRERHRVALSRARDALAEAVPHLGPDGEAVLAAHHIREATLALEELLGGVDVEEVLGRVFAGFCVGK
jgi:tRNA modification GTPase